MRPARTARMIPVLIAVLCITDIVLANEAPVADAGPSRYVGADPARLDGTGSYDPDTSGRLTYAWAQVAGPSVKIANADSPMPTIGGVGARGALSRFVQTDEIQTCQFELVVSDGELASPKFGGHLTNGARLSRISPFFTNIGGFVLRLTKSPLKAHLVVFLRQGPYTAIHTRTLVHPGVLYP